MNDVSPETFLNILKTRRSIRRFSEEDIDEADIKKLVEAASYAPSGSNLQNWHFLVIRSKKVKNEMIAAVGKKADSILSLLKSQKAKIEFAAYGKYLRVFAEAPVVIAVIKKPYRSLTSNLLQRYNIPYRSDAGIQGVSAAVQNLLLMAHVMGYGACWMTGPLIAKEEIEKVLKISNENELAALVPLGRYKEIPKEVNRKRIDEICIFID